MDIGVQVFMWLHVYLSWSVTWKQSNVCTIKEQTTCKGALLPAATWGCKWQRQCHLAHSWDTHTFSKSIYNTACCRGTFSGHRGTHKYFNKCKLYCFHRRIPIMWKHTHDSNIVLSWLPSELMHGDHRDKVFIVFQPQDIRASIHFLHCVQPSLYLCSLSRYKFW